MARREKYGVVARISAWAATAVWLFVFAGLFFHHSREPMLLHRFSHSYALGLLPIPRPDAARVLRGPRPPFTLRRRGSGRRAARHLTAVEGRPPLSPDARRLRHPPARPSKKAGLGVPAAPVSAGRARAKSRKGNQLARLSRRRARDPEAEGALQGRSPRGFDVLRPGTSIRGLVRPPARARARERPSRPGWRKSSAPRSRLTTPSTASFAMRPTRSTSMPTSCS